MVDVGGNLIWGIPYKADSPEVRSKEPPMRVRVPPPTLL